jgi:small-conductance mechanosensitive channel
MIAENTPARQATASVRDLLNGNSPATWLITFAVAAGALVVLWAVRAIIRRRFRNVRETATEIDDLAFDLARRTKLFLLLFPALFLGARMALLELPIDQARLLRIAARLSLITQGALWISSIADFWLRRYRRTRVEPESQTIAHVFGIAIAASVWSVAVLVALANLGFNITAIVAGLGVGGVAVALALQNILGDLFASLSIIIDKPFVVGDAIRIDQQTGVVEQIGMKTTRIRAAGGEELIVGNGDLLKSRIHNFKRMTRRRAYLRIGVDPHTPAASLARIPLLLRGAIEKQQGASFERAHLVTVSGNGHEFEAVYSIDSPEQTVLLDTQQSVNLDVLRALESEQIALAGPVVAAK